MKCENCRLPIDPSEERPRSNPDGSVTCQPCIRFAALTDGAPATEARKAINP